MTWSRMLSGPTAAVVAVAVMTLSAQAILLRNLPLQEAGRFALLLAINEILAMIADAGQPTLLLRAYSHQPEQPRPWAVDLLRSLLIAGPVLALGPLLVGRMYHLPPWPGRLPGGRRPPALHTA